MPDVDLFFESEVRELLRREEGQFLEFKSLWDLSDGSPRAVDRRAARDFVAEAVAAFANADGGTLLLGVDDDGTPSGHGFPEDAVADLLLVPERRLRPPVACRIQRALLDGREILIFQVPLTLEAVMVDGNGFPYRAGKQVIREPQEVINQRKTAYRRVGYEQRFRPDARLEDLDLSLAERFLSGSIFRERPVVEALAQLGLVVPRAGEPAITNAALLLFGREPALRWHPRAGIRFFRVEGRERLHGARRNVTQLQRVELPLATAVERAFELAREHIRRSERLHDLFFREMPEYPQFAWQEGLVNAVAHRDYEDQGREIEVWFFSDRLEVKSPGDLVPPVTLEHLRERAAVHASRNPLLVRVFADVGLMRDEGEGIARMFEEMQSSYLNDPELSVEAATFTVTLRNEPIFSGVNVEWAAAVRKLPLSLAQRRVLVAHPQTFTNEDYRALNGVDRDDAYQEIQQLVRLGIVAPSGGPGRGTTYRVMPDAVGARGNAYGRIAKPAIPPHKPPSWMPERLAKLRTYLGDHPHLKNADYRELFELSREAALRELRLLVKDDFLRLEGARRGARYLPGSRLREEEK